MRRPAPVAALLLCLALPVQGSSRTLVERIAAIVGDEVVLLSEVDEVLRMVYEPELRAVADANERERRRHELRLEVLDQLIGDKLIEQAIIEDQIKVTDEELEQQIDAIARENSLTLEQLEQALAAEGMTMREYRRDLRKQMERQLFVRMEIAVRVVVDEAQVRAEYKRRKDGNDDVGLFRLQRLRVPGQLAEGALDDLEPARREGLPTDRPVRPIDLVLSALADPDIDFDKAARLYSDLPGAATEGSDMGLVDPRELAEPFRSTIAALGVGDISPPVDVQGDTWMFKCIGTETPTFPEFEELRAALTDELWQREVERQIERWVERRRTKAHVEVKL
jgi:peptidyl-prolyl cis-trans isomerase SurA